MQPLNLTSYPYPSSRPVMLGKRGAVATSQPLATTTGAEILLAGGNAVDAAIAMAIDLTIVEPTSNGLGSDAFALVWDDKLHGLNASGKSPQALSPDLWATMAQLPLHGWLAATVPGAVSAWQTLWRRWGQLPFERLFEPAIRHAEDGFPVSPITARSWQQQVKNYSSLTGELHQPFLEVFFPGNRAPRAGEIWRCPDQAATLRELAATEGESFYQGKLAEQFVAFSEKTGGVFTLDDLQRHQAEWVTPISTTYRGMTVSELPPNGQGIAALMALNIVEGFDLTAQPRDSVANYHQQIEAMKLAFADAHRYVADPRTMDVTTAELLDKTYGARRRELIGDRAMPLAEPGLPKGGTVYLAAADDQLMVSFIQSNFMGFGSGIVIPGTGIAVQNRGAGFVVDAEHPNAIAPGKRPFHTIIPGFLSRDGQPLGPFGVMGASMQPQGHLQVVSNLVDHGLNPQAALDAPRWRFDQGNRVFLEQTVPRHVVLGLSDLGHAVQVVAEPGMFGKGQVILRLENGVLVAGSEPRADGIAIVL
ncbi:gamma-glutamyltransferase family protein [Leptothoe spongobia]|uniref:Gamma-glutamyltransferase family protein n=1 Tax=Leptothoe spongobia TAU-MAC 1115 TaxID=1967444 RepID=A0A947DDN9_9CYAN|nr:gamma-glutamyltransferase family protein [Leptothoe spongobia]MBT9314429.1 gamma-glutamyltransferase family protein [Leptothoe spongobia TAU-MAC 1115]